MSTPMASTAHVRTLLSDWSLEMTGKDLPHLADARNTLPQGSRINVTYLEHEDLATRLAAARAVRESGFVPVPHLSARRLTSQEQLKEYLAALAGIGACEQVFCVGGDPATPHGPFPDSLSLIISGLLGEYGVRGVSIAGYPEGHPDIPAPVLWDALTAKAAALREAGLPGTIITQFGFDVDPVLAWIEQVREHGVDLPIRVGVPGPAGIRRLVRYAARFGVSTSAGIARKYGFSITNLIGTAGPDRFLHELAERLDNERHGQVKVHFYTFGGLGTTSSWVADFQKEERA